MNSYRRRLGQRKQPPSFMPVGESKAAKLAAELRDIDEKRKSKTRVQKHKTEKVEAVDVAKQDNNEGIEKLKAERDEYLTLARRERAEFDNYRKRVARDMQNIKREALAGFLKEFFGPLDDLGRVLTEASKTHSYETLHDGVRILEDNLWKAFAKANVKKINAKGKPFNPEFHEAMAAVPSADVPPNTVLDVFDNGYKLDDFVLRPARVVVSREPDA